MTCGCLVVKTFGVGSEIEYCPLHQSAPELLSLLKAIKDYVVVPFGTPENTSRGIALLIAKAEGAANPVRHETNEIGVVEPPGEQGE